MIIIGCEKSTKVKQIAPQIFLLFLIGRKKSTYSRIKTILPDIPEMIEMKQKYILVSSCPNLDEIITRVWWVGQKNPPF